jgi:hypothetical protein
MVWPDLEQYMKKEACEDSGFSLEWPIRYARPDAQGSATLRSALIAGLAPTRWCERRQGLYLLKGAHGQCSQLSKKFASLLQYLCQLRKAEGGLRGMNTTQAGDLVKNLA